LHENNTKPEANKDRISLPTTPNRKSYTSWTLWKRPWPWPWPMTLTCKFVLDFALIYITTEQKTDSCNRFQVMVRTDTCTDGHTCQSNASYMHVFMIVW